MKQLWTRVVLAEGTNPGVSPTWSGLPAGFRNFLVEIVGTVMNVGIVLGVLVLVVGAIGAGIASWSGRPGVAGKFIGALAIGAAVAIVCGGANNLIAFFAGKGATIFL